MGDLQTVLERLTAEFRDLSPQLRQAAKFVLDEPAEVAINSMRQVASRAGVAPSTMLRLARVMGHANYEDFRAPFRNAMRSRGEGYGDRAKWLQETRDKGEAGALFSGLAEANLANVEDAFQAVDPASLERAAKMIRKARRVYILGIGGGYSLAYHLYYVGRMALGNLRVPSGFAGRLVDDLIEVGKKDVIVPISYHPYTSATVEATEFARSRGAAVIAITDSRASPLAADGADLMLTPSTGPQFFPSYVAGMAMIEALIAFIVSTSDSGVVDKIAKIEKFRHDIGVYCDDAR